MAKRKHSILGFFLKIIIGILVFFIVITGAGLAVAYFAFGINVFEIIDDVNILNEKVNTNEIAPNQFTDDDLKDASINSSLGLDGFIYYDEETASYQVNFDKFTGIMTREVRFTDRQVGAMMDKSLEKQDLTIEVDNKTIDLKEWGFKLMQIDFSNIKAESAYFNAVAKIDLYKLKDEMTSLPFSWVKGHIPNTVYISSTVCVTHLEEAFTYSIESADARVNNLKYGRLDSLLEVVNKYSNVGTLDEINEKIGYALMDNLLGKNDTDDGILHSLIKAGAKDYKFETDGEKDYIAITMA